MFLLLVYLSLQFPLFSTFDLKWSHQYPFSFNNVLSVRYQNAIRFVASSHKNKENKIICVIKLLTRLSLLCSAHWQLFENTLVLMLTGNETFHRTNYIEMIQ